MERFLNSVAEDCLSQLVQDETGKRQHYRPVYSLHKWWARRPGSLFRAILLAAHKAGRPLFFLSEKGAVSPLSLYYQGDTLEDVIVFDPFMGGGTTLVEANRLGAKVIGCDLNPVAYWIVRETLKPIHLDRLDEYFRQLEQTAGEKIKDLYKTTCIHCGHDSDSLYAFWVRFIPCPYCGENVLLYKRTLLNEGQSRNKPVSSRNPATVFCPRCFALNEWYGDRHVVCRYCGIQFNPREGTYNQGYFSCPVCHHDNIALLELMRSGQRLQDKLIAIEYWCGYCRQRLYKAPDSKDLGRLRQIAETFAERREHLIYPRQRILEGDSSLRWRLHNFTHYHDVFNPRQILAFNILFDGIRAIPEEEYRYALITIFSNALEYNNMMTPYNYPHRKLHHLFNYHALPLTTTPVENAVWGVGGEGAGTFVNCYRRYVQAKQYCLAPFDRYKDAFGKVHTVYARNEHIEGRFVSSWEELRQTARGVWLLCRDSSFLPEIPSESVDFVITDPPYFDSIHYSELSNFFYVWLACLIEHPCFGLEHVPTEAEAIVNNGMKKGEQEYQQLLRAVFTESGRILKRTGKLIFTFHHTNWKAWWTMLTAITESGFRIVDSFPVLSEYKVNPHIRNKQALDMDLVLICEKRSLPFQPLSLETEDILERAVASLNGKSPAANQNKLFLHFMGEVLRTASSHNDISYNWFESTLSRFDDFVLKAGEKTMMASTLYVKRPLQLRLMERKGKDA